MRPDGLRRPETPPHTRPQWEDHQATQLPFRIWCPRCGVGRLDNPPHKRAEPQETDVPEVHLDYAFCRRQAEERVAPLLLLKHRHTRAVRCWAVPQKGALGIVAAETAEQRLKDFGQHGRCHIAAIQ